MKKTVFLFDEYGKFNGEYTAQESPREPGIFITPIRSTEIAPPSVLVTQFAQWNGVSWDVIDIPVPDPHVPTPEEIAAAAKAAQDAQDAQDAKYDAKFQSLIAMNPAQAKQWAKSSFPTLTLAEQRDLGTLVQCIAILGRRL